MGGGMEVNKNKYIEEWNSARENLEHNFRWTRRNFALVGLFGIALPILVYKGIVKEFASPGSVATSESSDPTASSTGKIWPVGHAFDCPFLGVLIGRLLVYSVHMQDEDAGRPHRKFL